MAWVHKHKKEVLFGGLVCLQLIAVFVYNLFLRYKMDYDSSSGIVQMAEICRQNKLLIDDWQYQTTTGWDIPLLLGILFYKITGQIFISVGLANIIFVMAYLFVIWDILRQYKIGLGNRLLVLAVFLTPYTGGSLGYQPMLFTGTASYSLKVLIPLLLIDLIVRYEMGRKQKTNIVLFVLMATLSFVTAVSSGVYVLICGIFPFVVYVFFQILANNNIRLALRRGSLVVYCGMAASILGLVVRRFVNIGGRAEAMSFVPIEKFAHNALNVFVAIWGLFGGIPHAKVEILSVIGVVYICRILVATGFVALILYYVVRVFKKSEKRTVVLTALCIQLVNIGVFLLADLSYTENVFEIRYYILPIVAAMLLAGIFFEESTRGWNVLCRRTVTLFLLMSVAVCSVSRFVKDFTDMRTARIDQMNDITDMAKKQGVDLIYFLCYGNDYVEDGRVMRVCDLDVNVTTLAEYNSGIAWGGSTRFFENSRHRGPVMAVISQDQVQELPVHVRNRMNYVDTLHGYQVYYVSENIFDCSAALPNVGENGIDFMYSPGYQIVGNINEMGNMVASREGGTVMVGPWHNGDGGIFDITLNYETGQDEGVAGTVVGKLSIYGTNEKVICTSDIVTGKNELVLKHVTPGSICDTFRYTIDAVPDSGLVIKSIVTERVQNE